VKTAKNVSFFSFRPMALITLRILDGPERGTAFHQLAVPVSIGREDGNIIQLNDERVSRFHLKIHENGGDILLTDLQSTNGTRVNGEVVQVWRLRPGDVISLGRSLLIFGASDEIAKRLTALNKQNQSAWIPMGVEGDDSQFLQRTVDARGQNVSTSSPFELEIFRGMSSEELAPLHLLAPPKTPTNLTPKQAAQMSEFLQYIHLRLRYLVSTVKAEPTVNNDGEERITLEHSQWQNLLDLYGRIAIALHMVTDP